MKSAKNIICYVTFFSVFILHPSLNRGENLITHLQYLVYGNSIDLSYDDSIDKNEIDVKVNKIPFEVGNQKLVVYYKNRMIGTLTQNKSIRKQAHQYSIRLKYKERNALIFNGKITGPSPGYASNESLELASN